MSTIALGFFIYAALQIPLLIFSVYKVKKQRSEKDGEEKQ